MQQEKCKTCEFWVADEFIDATPKTQPLMQGKCHRNPPTTQLMQVPGNRRLDVVTKQMQETTQIQMLPILPPTFENHFCGEHPDAVRRRANELIYSPSVHGDGNAGFNRAPQLSDALRFSDPEQTQSMIHRYAVLTDLNKEKGLSMSEAKEQVDLYNAIRKVVPDFQA